MKKTLFAFCLALLVPTATFSGIQETQRIKKKCLEKPLKILITERNELEQQKETLIKERIALEKSEVVFHIHVPSLETLATAHLSDENDQRITREDWQNHRALTDTDVALPQKADAFWYACLKGDKRISSDAVNHSTLLTEIDRSVYGHGLRVSQENAPKIDELNQKIGILTDTLSKIYAIMATATHKKFAQRR